MLRCRYTPKEKRSTIQEKWHLRAEAVTEPLQADVFFRSETL